MTEDGTQNNRVKFAPLTAGLLARKGEAHPASAMALADDLGPQAYHLTRTPMPVRATVHAVAAREPGLFGSLSERMAALRDRLVGANVLDEESPAPAARAEAPAPEEPAGPPAAVVAAPAEAPAPAERCPTCPGDGPDERRFHVSIRLKRSRYLRLKLAAATMHRPSQEIIGEALDAYFTQLDPAVLGSCPCMKA